MLTTERGGVKIPSSKQAIDEITAVGWYFVSARGSHHYFEHPTRTGKVSVPHPKKDLPIGTYRSILKQAGII